MHTPSVVSTVAVVTVVILSTIGSVESANITTSLTCANDSMLVSYVTGSNTFNPTEGRIYVDGFYDDVNCFTASAPWELNVTVGNCGTAFETAFTVILLHDKDYYLETIDSAQTFTCKASSYATTMHNVSAYVPAGEIIPIVGQEANVPGFDVTITLRLRNTSTGTEITPSSPAVILGGNVTLELTVDPYAPVKIQAVRCWAAGIVTSNGVDSWKYLDLISQSCPAVPFFGRLQQNSTFHSLTSTFPMFLMTPRHASNRTTGFFCTVKACDVTSSDCNYVNCTGAGESGPSWGRRRRRAAALMAGDIEDTVYDGDMSSTDDEEDDGLYHPMGKNDVGKVALGYFLTVYDPEEDINDVQLIEPDGQPQWPGADSSQPGDWLEPGDGQMYNTATAESTDEICINNYVLVIVTVLIGLVVIAFCWISVCFFAYVRKRSARQRQSSKTEIEM
ncbi:uncharacterized protein LOC106151078 [Lingula anatina]|uniref:Uncharacterized protein LOC106151078 n=1 Tax=Lingula anatina TaxID=7574 RepID=A0A1S3H146_LINAN|nr:uncharacterized protein LOC106151078 [Lingula anatina]|eukprot:XP_013379657.1 uncharacterized protein LOC106151078 [Lingula anatina]